VLLLNNFKKNFPIVDRGAITVLGVLALRLLVGRPLVIEVELEHVQILLVLLAYWAETIHRQELALLSPYHVQEVSTESIFFVNVWGFLFLANLKNSTFIKRGGVIYYALIL
jgi:hypothetical protein